MMADQAEAARKLVGRREGVFTNPFASPLSAVHADRSSEHLVPVFLSEMERQDFESDVQEFVERIHTRQRAARSMAAWIRFSCVAGAASITMCGVVDGNIFGWESGKLASMLGAVLTLALVLNNRIGVAERAERLRVICAYSLGFSSRFRKVLTDGEKLQEYDRFLVFRKESARLSLDPDSGKGPE